MAALRSRGEIAPLWAATDADSAWRKLQEQPVDVAVLDVKLGSGSQGLELLRRIVDARLSCRCLMLSSYHSERVVREAYRLGAAGFFSKSDDIEAIADGIVAAASGASAFLGPHAEWARPNPLLELSARETEVLRELARGRSNQEMARALGLQIGTVKKHLESIYLKLGASSRTEAMRLALTQGYVFVDELQA